MTTTIETTTSTIQTGNNITVELNGLDPFAALPALRQQINDDLLADKASKTTYLQETDGRQARLTQRGYQNALELLKPEHRDRLVTELQSKGILVPTDELGFFSSIAKLQLGYENDNGEWKVKSRRDARLAELYRIIHLQNKDADRNNKPRPWNPAELAAQIMDHQGGVDGIKKAYRAALEKPDTRADFERAVVIVAQHDPGLGKVQLPGLTSLNTGKSTHGFVLALVSITDGVGTIHELLEAPERINPVLKRFVPAKAENLAAATQAAGKN